MKARTREPDQRDMAKRDVRLRQYEQSYHQRTIRDGHAAGQGSHRGHKPPRHPAFLPPSLLTPRMG
jgi:hypothetical protein